MLVRLGEGTPNEVAITRARLEAAGVQLTDLTDSNPTRHGLTDPRIGEAVARAASAATATYAPLARGPRPAREALAGMFGGGPDDYWLASSTSEAYAWLFAILGDPGQAVAVPVPGYPLVEPLAAYARLAVRGYPSHYLHPHGWLLDVDRAAGVVADPQVAAVVAVSPGNPTGAYVTGAERTQLVELCATAGKALIVDEVFAAFPLDEAEPEPWGGEDRCVTIALGGLSKLVAAPSLKLAWLRLSGPRSLTAPVAAALDQVADMFLPVSAPVAAALPQILDLAPAVAGRINARLATNLATAREVLDAPFRVRRCGGGWTAVVDAPRLVPDDGLALALMTHAHLAVHPGWFYDLPDEASLALSLLPEPAVFRDHCTRLRRALQELAEADATGTSHLSPSV